MPGADELPGRIAAWTPDPARAVLLIHDMQKYFLRAFPTDCSPLAELTGNVIRLRRACARAGTPVAYTMQPGGMTPRQRGLLADFWGPGMTADPAHREVVDGLAPAPGDWILTKWRYSAFHRTDLLAGMRRSGRDQLLVCGVYAHVGVLMTACEAFTHDIQPFLAADAVADFTPQHHRMALDYAAGRCAVVATTDRLLADLGAAPETRG
ncbi:isochorismate hydrolase [Actinoplanes teichomyceticus]|uniref:Isochorismate hydrolase n=2 Tax=Actinoplanes teichomyceticus TaxID=1867 RepID=A0A561WK20_ACTTI|nr:isochorismate hydrolase [Actinoplanes teichomyceticus]GIF12941.1 phenazine biosynthesis protein PhzD [Actinoplanes teichomyceticus]